MLRLGNTGNADSSGRAELTKPGPIGTDSRHVAASILTKAALFALFVTANPAIAFLSQTEHRSMPATYGSFLNNPSHRALTGREETTLKHALM